MDITELLAFSAKQGASDLHLSAGLPPMIRVDGDIRRVTVPNFTDHNHIGVLPQERPQRTGKVKARHVVDLKLVDAADTTFNRVFHCTDIDLVAIKFGQRGIECRILTRTGRAGHQNDSVGMIDHLLERLKVFIAKAK